MPYKTENTPTIETNRLILRKFSLADTASMLEILSDKEVNTFLPWHICNTIDEASEFIQSRFLSSYNRPSGYRYAICLKEDNKPIGYVWLSTNNSNDFGYALKKEFWGKGIASEASQAVINLIKEAGYPYITATHDINNPRSGDVMKRLGMTYQYSYVEQWQPKDISVTFRMYQLNFDVDSSNIYMEYWNSYDNHFIEENI